MLFSYELARRLHGTSVTANALHPGVVSTSFGAEDPATVQRVFVPFLRRFMKTPAQGAATSIHLASAPDLEQVTGRYFADSKPKRSSKRSYDEAAAARLWQVSADLVGLTATADTPRGRHPQHPNLRRTTMNHDTRQHQGEIMNRKLTAALLITAAVLTNAAFTVLGTVFNYPDILEEPVDDILAAFRAHQTAVRRLVRA